MISHLCLRAIFTVAGLRNEYSHPHNNGAKWAYYWRITGGRDLTGRYIVRLRPGLMNMGMHNTSQKKMQMHDMRYMSCDAQ